MRYTHFNFWGTAKCNGARAAAFGSGPRPFLGYDNGLRPLPSAAAFGRFVTRSLSEGNNTQIRSRLPALLIGKRSNQTPVMGIALERMVKKGVDLGNAIVRIASIADDVVLASAETAGRVGVAAGSTTARVLSGTFAGVGIVFGAYDIYKGVNDIGGSEIAEKYREFAEEYDDETESIAQFIHRLQTAIV